MKYIDINGNKKHADSGQDKLLKLLYTTRIGRMLLRPLVTPAFSKLAGALLNTSFSCRLIKPFVRSNAIDMSDYEETCYRSYNDFFTRKIKKGAREISGGSPDLISPCDCYASAYEISDCKKCRIYCFLPAPQQKTGGALPGRICPDPASHRK